MNPDPKHGLKRLYLFESGQLLPINSFDIVHTVNKIDKTVLKFELLPTLEGI
jgi:hypothetical protein